MKISRKQPKIGYVFKEISKKQIAGERKILQESL